MIHSVKGSERIQIYNNQDLNKYLRRRKDEEEFLRRLWWDTQYRYKLAPALNGSAVTASGSDSSFTLQITPANGDLVIVVIQSANAVTSVSDDLSNTYQQDLSFVATDYHYVYSFYYASNSAQRTITVNLTWGQYTALAQRVSGISSSSYKGTTSTYDNGWNGSAGTYSWNSGSPSPNYASGSFILGAFSSSYGNTTSWAATGNYTKINTNSVGGFLGVCYWVSTSSGNTAVTGTDTTSGQTEDKALLVEYKAAAGASDLSIMASECIGSLGQLH